MDTCLLQIYWAVFIWHDCLVAVVFTLAALAENMEKSTYRFQRTNENARPIATYGCESWTLRKNEETRLDAFEMKGRRKILRVSWTTKKTNEWVLNKAGVKREMFDTVKARILWSHHGETKELPWERWCKEQCEVHAVEEDHARPWWTTSIRGQNSPWKSQSEWQRTEINGESTTYPLINDCWRTE